MTWPALMGWLAEMGRQRDGRQADPESWAGAENDPFWVKREREREMRLHGG